MDNEEDAKCIYYMNILYICDFLQSKKLKSSNTRLIQQNVHINQASKSK